MRLSQSVVLWQGRGGIQKIALFGKRPCPYYGKNSSNKQRETTVHHYFKTWRSVNAEHFKSFKSLFKDSRKTIKHNDEILSAIGKEDPELPLLQRISSLELSASEVAAQINASQLSSNRHISTSTFQRRLRESGLHGWISLKKPLLKDTNKENRLAWAEKHEKWILDQWKAVLWSDGSKFEIFASNRIVFVRRSVGELMISTCVVPMVKHGGGGVMVWGAFLVTVSVIYLEFKAYLTSILRDTHSHLVCA